MLGTGDFALPTFLHLIERGHCVRALVTQPDRPQGRKQERIPSAIKVAATEHMIPVLQPEDVNADAAVAAIRALEPDLLVTAAYGQILSAELLGVPRLGGINLHGSVLPAYRGAAPVARAIQSGETETGVTVIFMTPRIDAGGMIKVARTPIDPNETAGALEDRLARLGAPLVVEAIAALADGRPVVIAQKSAKVTRAPKLRKEDGQIDWKSPALTVHNHVRAMQPWPIAFSHLHRTARPQDDPPRIIIHKTEPIARETTDAPGTVLEASGDRLIVAAGSGAVRLLVIQAVGKKALPVSEALRGLPIQPGDHFGD